MTHVRLTDATETDRAAPLLRAYHEETGADAPDPEWLAERIGDLIRAGEASVLLAGDGPEGIAVLRFRPALWSTRLECYLAQIYVVPAWRGLGIASALVLAACAHARESGAEVMSVTAAADDRTARNLYEGLGFATGAGAVPSLHYRRPL